MTLAVLVSGSGTILEAILEAGIIVDLVVADRPCRGLEVGEAAGATSILLDRAEHGGFSAEFDRTAYTDDLATLLVGRGIGLVAMAGFGTVLGQPMHDAFPGRILNTHPALLPAFPGWHGVADALAAGASVTGCTVHFCDDVYDHGPIVLQRICPVLDTDDAHTLAARVFEEEKIAYPEAIRLFAAGRLRIEGRRVRVLGG